MPDPRTKLYKAISSEFDLGSQDEFNSKMDNPESRKKLYNAVSNKFDLGSFDEFEGKVAPVKKKENFSLLSNPKQNSESNVANGSLASTENTPPKKVSGKPIVNKTPIATIENKYSPVSVYNDFMERSKVSDQKKQEIVQEVNDEAESKGAWNTFKTTMSKITSSVPKWMGGTDGKENDLLYEEKAEVKKQYQQEVLRAKSQKKSIPSLTPQELTEKAKALRVKKKIKSESDSNVRELLKEYDSDPNKKEALIKYTTIEKASLSDKDKLLVGKQNMLQNEVDTSFAKMQELTNQAKQLSEKGIPISNELKVQFENEQAKYQSILKDAIATKQEYISNTKDLGEFKDNLDVFKRDYGWINNFVGNVASSSSDIVAGLFGAGDYALNVKESISPEFLKPVARVMDAPLRSFFKESSERAKGGGEKERAKIMKPVDVENINTFGDFGSWMSNTVIANQIPIFATVATGVPGITALGVSATGNKFEEMQQEMNPTNPEPGMILKDYSDAQLAGIPLGFGITETISATVDKILLGNASRVVRSATAPERNLIAQGFWKEIATNSLKGGAMEGLDESGTQIAQNIIDIYAGDKENVKVLDGVKDAGSAGAVMGFMIPFGSHVVAQATKPFQIDNKIQKASAEVLKLQAQLDNTELSDGARTTISTQLDQSKAKVETLLKSKINDIESLSDAQFQEIIGLEKTQANLKNKAKEIQTEENLTDDMKKQIIGNLQDEFKANEQRRVDLLERGASVQLEQLDDKEQIRLKDEASRELMKEQNPDGTKNITLNDNEISKRAVQIYNNEVREKAKEVKPAEATLPRTPENFNIVDDNITPVNNLTESTENIEEKSKDAESKIKNKGLFSDGGTFSMALGGSDVNSVATGHQEINGIEFVQYSNPNTGVVDVIMSGTSDSDFVGYYRIYENGKPTDRWSSKFENQSRNKDNFKTMISGVQAMLPEGHQYTEKTSISTDGLRVWEHQLSRGYEMQYDNNGNVVTNTVMINGDSIVNELGIDVNVGNFENISVTNNTQFESVKKALLPYLKKFGLNESNIRNINGSVEIDLPVLLSKNKTNAINEDVSRINEGNIEETPENIDVPVDEKPEKITEEQKMQFGAGYKDYDFKKENISADKIKITEQPSLSENQDLVEDIKKNGIKEPIVVEYDKESDSYYVKNGNHRTAIAKELGIKEIPTIIAELKDNNDETAPNPNITPDANVQPGTPIVDENGTTEQENIAAENVSETINNGTSESDAKVKKYKLTEKGQAFTVQNTNGKLEVLNDKGEKTSKPTERDVLRKHADNTDLAVGQKASELENFEREDYANEIATKSNNPAEVADAITSVQYENPSEFNAEEKTAYKETVIREGIVPIVESGFDRFNDRNNKTKKTKKAYFDEEGRDIDELAQELSDRAGIEITPNDIADFIAENPNGLKEANAKAKENLTDEQIEKNNKIIDLKNRFTELTGLPATNEFLTKAVEQNNRKFELNSVLDQLTESEYEALEAESKQFEIATYGTKKENITGKGNVKGKDNSNSRTKPRVQSQNNENGKTTESEEVKPKKSKIQEVFNQENIQEDLDWLDSLKIDTNNLNSTLPFLPQVFNALIDAVKVARMAGNSLSKAIEIAREELGSKFKDTDVQDAINAFAEKAGITIEPKVEAKPKKEKNEKTSEPSNKQKPQAFTTRAFNAENISGRTRDKLDGLGLNYDVESQAKAQENAETIIAELGIIDAYNLAKEGQIRGGARTWIMAQMFEDLNNQINEASEKGETDLVEYLSDELSKIMKTFANEKTLTGQEIAMLNRIYNKFGMKYDLEFARENWKKRFGTEIPVEVEAKLKKAEADIKEYEKKVKELEERIGTLEEQDAMDNLKDVVKKHNTKKPSASSLKKAATALRQAKFTKSISDLSKLQSDSAGLVKALWDGAIETIATALDAGSTIEQAVKKGVEQIKNSDWYKGLSKDGKKQAERIAKTDFKAFIDEQIEIPTSSIEPEQGAVKITADLIYSLVESGIDNIVDLTQAVHDAISKDYPNLTLREVRDAITGYGRQVAETQDDIKKEISRMKTDGKQMSALDDLAEGKRPKRSGRKAKEYTPEQRNRIKQIRELLKTLPFDDAVDKAKYYKNALEAYKTRLENRIKDLNDAMKKNERIVNERRNTTLDNDAKELIKQRDEAQKQYDDYFGKPYKSDETLINEIVARKEKSLRDLELKIESVKLEGKELPKKERRTVTDPKIDALEKEIQAKREELNDVLEEVGIAEGKRLERGIKYSKRRLKELNEKIANGDFTKRKPKTYKYNRELIELKGEILIAKTKWDIEFEKQEFKNLGYGEKFLEYVYRLFGTVKGLKATIDLSAMLRQGIILGSSNPIEFVKASFDMHKFAFDSKFYKDWMTNLESADDYIYIVEDGVSITDTSGDVLRSEERFVGNLLVKEVKVGGVDVNIPGRLMAGSERAYGGFLNHLRVAVYRKIVKKYEKMGITRQEHPKKYKNIGRFVNNTTGRGSLTPDKRIAKALNIVFFSPRMITGMAGTLKDLVRSDSTPYLRRQAAYTLFTFIGYQFAMKMLIAQALGLVGDDDEEVTMDMNPVSTDFNKVKKGNKRYSTGSGYDIALRTGARFILNEKTVGKNGKVVNYDDMWKENAFGEVGSFLNNKLSPLASQMYKYKVNEHPTDFFGKREDAKPMDYVEALIIPISVMDLIENIQEGTPEGEIFLDLMLNTYGVGVQSYGDKKKPKTDKN